MNWQTYSYVVRSIYRKKVIKVLDIERTPSQIAKLTKLNNSHVSRALAELEKKNIVNCLTPKQILGRVYGLTSLGKGIRKHLEKSEK